MNRDTLLSQLERPQSDPWDIAIIGGGAVGLGTALDAVSRGHSCVLLEQHDFGKGTSSRSTKLIHGGVRYLAQGNVSLVREALHERGLLLRNASPFVSPLRFLIPCESTSERWYYWTGMKLYDALAGQLGIRPSKAMSPSKVRNELPNLVASARRGGAVAYYDAQFDDARLLIAVAQEVVQRGGVPVNYVRVAELISSAKSIKGLVAVDLETDRQYNVYAKCVVNATGAFSDAIRRLENPRAESLISPSQGIHLVVDRHFLGSDDAMMIPKTDDGRVLFAIPWLGKTLLGTTDTGVPRVNLEPSPLSREIDYLLEHFSDYLSPAPTRSDVLSAFAGLRPLVKPGSQSTGTSKISREHRIDVSNQQLVSILGGKWTTFRKMAEDAVDVVERLAGLKRTESRTKNIQLGREMLSIDNESVPSQDIIGKLVQTEFARTVEDVLARRYRCLLLDAGHSVDLATDVARAMAHELQRPPQWVEEQVAAYTELARAYLC